VPSSLTACGSGTLPAISRVSARLPLRHWKTQFSGWPGASCSQRVASAAPTVASSSSGTGWKLVSTQTGG
jgi:hypothetical protein